MHVLKEKMKDSQQQNFEEELIIVEKRNAE